MVAEPDLLRRSCGEAIGTAMLLAAIVGSGIMGERLAAGNVAVTLLANSIATGAALAALIATFSSITGAHFNPVVSVAEAAQNRFRWRDVPAYIVAQFAGAFAGAAAAHLMFGLPLFSSSHRVRSGGSQMFGEFIATFGLVLVVQACARYRPSAIAPSVAAYITAGYWFTSSTSFANPAVTLARSVSDTFVGIRLIDVPGFILGQVIGGGTAVLLFRWLARSSIKNDSRTRST